MGRVVFKASESGAYVPEIDKPWYSKEEYKKYLEDQPKLHNMAAHGPDTSFFDAMEAYLGEFDEHAYDGDSLNDIIRDLP
jgi:hypothetical protein